LFYIFIICFFQSSVRKVALHTGKVLIPTSWTLPWTFLSSLFIVPFFESPALAFNSGTSSSNSFLWLRHSGLQNAISPPVHVDIFVTLKILAIKTDTQKALRGMTSTMKKTIPIFFNRSRASDMKTTTLRYINIKYLSFWFCFMRNHSSIIHRELNFTSRDTPIEIIYWTINNMYR